MPKSISVKRKSLIFALFIASCLGLGTWTPSHSYAAAGSCQRVWLDVPSYKKLKDLPRLRLMTFNLENFIYDTAGKNLKLKDSEKVAGVAKVILDQRPDILIVQEAQNQKALENFNEQHLSDRYRVFIMESLEQKGSNVGFLVKKDLDIHIEIESHRDFQWIDPVKQTPVSIFTRDLPALLIKENSTSTPAMIIFGNHGKSKINRPGDPESTLLRTAQIEAMAQIMQNYHKRFNTEVPMVIAGDFNTDVSKGPEMKPLKPLFKDAFDISPSPEATIDRATHSLHTRDGETHYNAMDAILVNSALENSIQSARVFRYKDSHGHALPLPETYQERSQNPSDHYPVVVDLQLP